MKLSELLWDGKVFGSMDYSPEQKAFLRRNRNQVRLVALRSINVLCMGLVVVLIPLDFNNVLLDLAWPYNVFFFIFVCLFSISFVYNYIISRRLVFSKNLSHTTVKRLMYLTVVAGSLLNIVFNVASVRVGSDFLGIIFGAVLFPIVFLMGTYERLYFFIFYYVLSVAAILVFFEFEAFRLFDHLFTLFTVLLVLYGVGHFIFRLWSDNQIKQFENKLVIEKLEEINQQQSNTFDKLSQAYQNLEYRGFVTSISDNIESGTISLIDLFIKAQNDLSEALAKYEDIFENVNDGIVILDDKSAIKDLNKAAQKMLEIEEGYDFTKISLQNLVYERDWEKSQQYTHQLLLTGEYKGYEGRILTPTTGKLKYVEVSSTAIYEQGVFMGSRDIVRDISQRKDVELEIQKARDSEKQFLASISHEIRTPLNAIIGMSHLLLDTTTDAVQKEYIHIINNASEFLLNLISDILDMAKIEEGKMEFNPHEFDFEGLLKTINQTFRLKLHNTPVSFILETGSNYQGKWLGDSKVLNQILFNIISNADKFTDKGYIKLKVNTISNTEDIFLIVFEIEDTGIGIAEDRLDQIFEKFKQVHSKNSEKHKGTGLGLALVKKFVTLQGGEVDARSQLGKGTIIRFTLPLRKISSEYKPTREDLHLPCLGFDATRPILIAEDNAMNRVFIERLMQKVEAIFEFAVDGREALQKLMDKPYALVFMDLEMPYIDGFEVVESVRKVANPNQNTPIVALTASAIKSIQTQAYELGMNEFLSKPFTPEQLYGVLNKYMELSQGY